MARRVILTRLPDEPGDSERIYGIPTKLFYLLPREAQKLIRRFPGDKLYRTKNSTFVGVIGGVFPPQFVVLQYFRVHNPSMHKELDGYEIAHDVDTLVEVDKITNTFIKEPHADAIWVNYVH